MDMEKEHGYNSQPRKEKTTNFRKPNPQREEDAVEKIDKIMLNNCLIFKVSVFIFHLESCLFLSTLIRFRLVLSPKRGLHKEYSHFCGYSADSYCLCYAHG